MVVRLWSSSCLLLTDAGHDRWWKDKQDEKETEHEKLLKKGEEDERWEGEKQREV